MAALVDGELTGDVLLRVGRQARQRDRSAKKTPKPVDLDDDLASRSLIRPLDLEAGTTDEPHSPTGVPRNAPPPSPAPAAASRAAESTSAPNKKPDSPGDAEGDFGTKSSESQLLTEELGKLTNNNCCCCYVDCCACCSSGTVAIVSALWWLLLLSWGPMSIGSYASVFWHVHNEDWSILCSLIVAAIYGATTHTRMPMTARRTTFFCTC